MRDSGRFSELVKEVDVALAEQRHLRARGAHLIITHLYHVPGTECAPGELVGNIALGGMTEPMSFGLSPRAMLMIDCFCRYRIPSTACRLAQILNTDPFYACHGANGNDGVPFAVEFDQRLIRVYMDRTLDRLAALFCERRLSIDPHEVLKATPTESNQLVYSLHATVEYLHIDL